MSFAIRDKKPAGNNNGAKKQQLQFINYQDPEKDSKKKENKKIVSKFAMLQRPRDEPAQVTSRKPSIKKQRVPPSYSSDSGSSPPTLVESSPSLDSLSVSSFDDVPQLIRPFGDLDEEWRKPSPDDQQTIDASGKLQSSNRSRKHLEQNRATRDAAAFRKQTANTALVRYGQNVYASIGSASEPFGALPINSSDNNHCLELLKLYVNVDLCAPVFRGDPNAVKRMQMIRRFTWFPLAQKSEATMSALSMLLPYLHALSCD